MKETSVRLREFAEEGANTPMDVDVDIRRLNVSLFLDKLMSIINSGYTSNEHVNQEVEKRIVEMMPSEMTLEEAEIAAKGTDYACFAVEPEGNEINFADAAAFYLEGWNACRSCLVSQKTDNLKENNNNGSTN